MVLFASGIRLLDMVVRPDSVAMYLADGFARDSDALTGTLRMEVARTRERMLVD